MPARPVTVRSHRRFPASLASVVTLTTGALAIVVTLALLGPLRPDAAPTTDAPVDLSAKSTNPVTPGNFTGYGFDQCLAPSQKKMDAWLEHSPFLAVGIYISGNSRACRSQPNLTPTWVRTQLTKGWRLLPISLGPQSSCVGRFPRYGAKIDPTISNSSTNSYAAARAQGKAEADTAVAAAQALGIVPGSTLWYDLEGWSNYKNATCRESALAFLTKWTQRIRNRGYVSGVYSSAGSGMKILDDARAARRTDVVVPDQIWVARWDNVANTSTSYLRSDGWLPGRRMKQYQGGHNETWGGVTINIDRNYLDLGNSTPAAETHCGGVRVDLAYRKVMPRTGSYRADPTLVKALQCLLKEKAGYAGKLTGNFNKKTRASAQAWQRSSGLGVSTSWRKKDWISLHAAGARPVLKIGSRGSDVRRVQRALQIAVPGSRVVVNGVYDATMASAVTAYRKQVGLPAYGVVHSATWAKLAAGAR